MLTRSYVAVIIISPFLVRRWVTKSNRVGSRSDILLEIKLPSVSGIV